MVAISPIVRKTSNDVPASIRREKAACLRARLNQVKTGRLRVLLHFPNSRADGPNFNPREIKEVMQKIMATPENLRERAKAADIAGEHDMADTLRAEADELENPTPAETPGESP